MKVLIDQNIQRRAITHTTIARPKNVQWGGREFETPGIIERVRIHPRPDETFIIEQLPYIATIGELARQSKISLWQSDELNWERFTQPGPNDGWCGFNLLFDVSLEWAPSPVDRLIAITGSKKTTVGLSKAEVNAFYKSINIPRFKEIRQAFGDSHIDDAFHLWTAESSRLDAFTTLDQRFIRQANSCAKKINTSVAVLSPKQLCERLNSPPTDIDELAARHPWWE